LFTNLERLTIIRESIGCSTCRRISVADLYPRYPKGSVRVTLRNDQPFYRQSQASSGVFIVYVAGADEPQQITHLQNEFTGGFSISPDGQWVVFERSKSLDEDRQIDLWITRIDGGNPQLLVRDGFSPSWR
jgi:WD40-like Beta Propeller Repeat